MLKYFFVMSVLLMLTGCAGVTRVETTSGTWTEVYTANMIELVSLHPENEESPEEIKTDEPTDTHLEPPEEHEEHDTHVIYEPEDMLAPEIKPETKIIALTFDDGPVRYTSEILDLLEKYNGRATFCVLGYRVENWAETVLRTVSQGSEVVGHSWTHRNMTNLDEEQIREEILAPSAAIKEASGIAPPPLFRAPFGQFNDQLKDIAEELGYALLQWSIDPRDWATRNPILIYEYIMKNATHGSIVLLHDIHESTLEAMYLVIPALVAQGFQLVTASEIIEYVYGQIEAGKVYRGIRPPEED